MALAERAAGGLAHHRENLGQHLLHRLGAFVVILDRAQPGFPFGDPLAQTIVALGRDLRLEIVDHGYAGPQAFHLAVVLRAEDFVCNSGKG